MHAGLDGSMYGNVKKKYYVREINILFKVRKECDCIICYVDMFDMLKTKTICIQYINSVMQEL